MRHQGSHVIYMDAYNNRRVQTVVPGIQGARSILDVGCGDMSLDTAILTHLPSVRITSLDVVGNPKLSDTRLRFRQYDGGHMPFRSGSFDAVVAYHVFHHCRKPEAVLSECARVARRRVVIVDIVIRNPLELPFIALVDHLANVRIHEPMDMPIAVRARDWWTAQWKANGLQLRECSRVGVLPEWLPIGVTTRFVLDKIGHHA